MHLLTAVADCLEIRPPPECLLQPATAKAVYAALLGGPPQTDSSYDVGFEAAGQHIRPVPGGGSHGMTSPVAYRHVPDLEAKLPEMTAAGATVKEPIRDVGGGRLVATVTDPRRQRPRAASGPLTPAA